MEPKSVEQQIAAVRGRAPLVDQVTALVLAHIRSNHLRPGERLPTTAEMAAAFAVAPTTLREALRRLEATGVVDVRHGVGVFVKSDTSRWVVAGPHRPHGTAAQLVSLVEARLLIEPSLAALAAERRGEEDLAALSQLLQRSAMLSSDRALAGQANLQFHAQIGACAGNQVLSDMLAAALDIHTQEQLEIDRLYDDPGRDHAGHVEVLEAIRAGDGDAARDAMRRHLSDVLGAVAQRLGEAS